MYYILCVNRQPGKILIHILKLIVPTLDLPSTSTTIVILMQRYYLFIFILILTLTLTLTITITLTLTKKIKAVQANLSYHSIRYTSNSKFPHDFARDMGVSPSMSGCMCSYPNWLSSSSHRQTSTFPFTAALCSALLLLPLI